MTNKEIQDLIKKGETSHVQFKKTFRAAEDIANEMIAFANCDGGLIVIGVEDKTGEIAGLSFDDARMLGSMIASAANDRMNPSIFPLVETYEIDGKMVMTIEVRKGNNAPYKNNKGEIYVKQGPDKRRVTDNNEILRLFYESGNYEPDRMPVEGTSIKDLDLVRLNEFFKSYYNTSLSDLQMPLEKALHNLDIMDAQGRLTMAGLLFFGDTPRFKYEWFMIKAVWFYGDNIGETQYRDSRDFIGTLPYMFDKGMDFLDSVLHHVQGNQNFNSVGQLEIPEVALREILQNALIHRSWIKPAPVRLLVFSDRVEIISPGALPNNLTVDDIKMGNAYQRNQLAATLCAKTMDYRGLGSGIVRALRADSDIEFHNEVSGDQFRAVLWRKRRNEYADPIREVNEGFTPYHTAQTAPAPLPEDGWLKMKAKDKIVEMLRREPRLSIGAMAAKLEMSVSGVERNLRLLKAEGRLKRIGADRGGFWQVLDAPE